MTFKMVALPDLPLTVGLITVSRDEMRWTFEGYVTALVEAVVWSNTGNTPTAPEGADAARVQFRPEEAERMAKSVEGFLRSPDVHLWVSDVRYNYEWSAREAWTRLGRDFATVRNGRRWERGMDRAGYFDAGSMSGAVRLSSWAFALGEEHAGATLHDDGSCWGFLLP